MPQNLEIFFDLLQQFTGTGGGAKHPIVQFGIAAIFWSLLLLLTYYSAGKQPQRHHKLFLIGFSLALGRESFMIAVKVLEAYGTFSGEQLHVVFPPLEHALSNISLIVVAAAFILYLTDEYVLTDRYLKAGVATIVVVYLSSFWYWAQYILINPASKFGQTWPELAFRGGATFWLVTAVGILMFRSRGWQRNIVCVALLMFSMNEFLKIVDSLTGEVNEPIYAAIRHSLYIAALPLLAYLYIREQSERLAQVFSELEEKVSARTADLESAMGELKILSESDGLTGLSNRRHFDERLDEELNRHQRQGESLALLIIDLDHFKAINDGLGHSAGDECLVAVAAQLKDRKWRDSDVIARYGGEEFALILPSTEVESALSIAEEIRQRIETMSVQFQGQPIKLTCSIGIACEAPLQNDSGQRILQEADRELYRAKNAGRNRVSCGTASGKVGVAA